MPTFQLGDDEMLTAISIDDQMKTEGRFKVTPAVQRRQVDKINVAKSDNEEETSDDEDEDTTYKNEQVLVVEAQLHHDAITSQRNSR